jgi:hypothetical protein
MLTKLLINHYNGFKRRLVQTGNSQIEICLPLRHSLPSASFRPQAPVIGETFLIDDSMHLPRQSRGFLLDATAWAALVSLPAVLVGFAVEEEPLSVQLGVLSGQGLDLVNGHFSPPLLSLIASSLLTGVFFSLPLRPLGPQSLFLPVQL